MEEEEKIPENIPEETPPAQNVEKIIVPENNVVVTEEDKVLLPEAVPTEQIAPETVVQNEKMEVHHHPHGHHSRKWKDYLFEFLMLFLAVTAGFIVENLREHYIENKRVKQYSEHLLADLRLDSTFFENRNRDLQTKLEGHDKLQNILTQKPEVTDKEILETLLPITYAYDLPVTTTTYNQMKTSGSLRYVDNLELTAVLQNYYDLLLPRCQKLTEASLSYFSQYVNSFYLEHVRIQDFDPFNDTLINKQAQIINRSGQTNQQLANIMGGFRSLLKIQAITMNEPALKKIKEIIQLLKTEYGLE
jgi:hypothetical protein